MFIAYSIIAVLYSAMLTFSAILKIQEDPQVVRGIHEVIGVPLAFFPVLAACELAGAAGLLAGIRWPQLGKAAATGLILYFVVAILSHVRVGDFAGITGAVIMLALAIGALLTRVKARAAILARAGS